MAAMRDLVGNRYGRLVVIAHVRPLKIECRCDCGNMKTVYASNVTRGATTSCGCFARENTSLIKKKSWSDLAHLVSRSAVNDCWLWTGGLNHKGYGHAGIKEHGTHLAHRLAYIEACGPIPAGMIVRHSCDNPRCCNPAHLLLGTPADNASDRDKRGRRVDHGRGGRPMSPDTVRALRHMREQGHTVRTVAETFGVAEETARKAIRRHTYTEVRP